MFKYTILVSLIAWGGITPTHASNLELKPDLMGVVGDSISAGALAFSPAPTGLTLESLPTHPNALFSIVEGKESFSWASGKQTESHYQFLKRYRDSLMTERGLEVINISKSGAGSDLFETQAQELVNAMSSGQYASLAYVTVLIGANDLCSQDVNSIPPSDEEVRQNFLRGFARLAQIQQESPIRVLVSSIPRIPNLGTPEVLNAHTLFGLKCRNIRTFIFKECNSMTVWNNSDEYDLRIARVAEKNSVIAATVNEARWLYPQLKIAYSSAVFDDWKIKPEALAADCFHPNAEGQKEISWRLWKDQPWFR